MPCSYPPAAHRRRPFTPPTLAAGVVGTGTVDVSNRTCLTISGGGGGSVALDTRPCLFDPCLNVPETCDLENCMVIECSFIVR